MHRSTSRFPHPDAERSHMRRLVAIIDAQLALQDRHGSTDTLREVWAELVGALSLGPEPAVRECPVCHHIGMRAATLCGYCWTRLVPPANDSPTSETQVDEQADDLTRWEHEGGTVRSGR